MNSISDKYIFEALNNNTFNLQMLNETLWEIKDRSFSSLYSAQREITDVNRIDIDMSNYIVDADFKYTYSINTDLIGQNRDIYRKSKFYKKELRVEDVLAHPEIFAHSPLLFINGLLYTNYTIIVYDGTVSIKFNISQKDNGLSLTDFDNLVYRDINIKKFSEIETYNKGDYIEYIYPNGIRKIMECTENNVSGPFVDSYWKRGIGTGKMTLMLLPAFSSLYDSDYNHYMLNDVLSIGLMFKHGSKKYENDIVPSAGGFVFATTDLINRNMYQLLDGELTEHPGLIDYRFKYSLSKTQIDTIMHLHSTTSRPCSIRMVHLPNYMDKLTLGADESYFELPIKDYPIPIENMIMFKVTEDGQVFFDHDSTITQYYPNIYSINRTGTYKSIVYIMYSDISPNIDHGYYNELKIYHDNTKNILDKYKDASIPEKIKNYKHIDVKYNIQDYVDTGYRPDHLDYKIDKIKSLISKNGEFYRWYLKRLDMKNPRFYIDISDIDLSTRIKSNNHDEITSPDYMRTFDEDRYLIMVRSDPDTEVVLFIDNKLYVPDALYTVGEDILVYIPTTLLTDKSIIHVEKLENVTMKKKLTFGDDYVHISIPQGVNISANDIFLSIQTDSGEKYLINRPDSDKIFNIYTKDDSGKYVEIEPSAFYQHKDIYIELLDESIKDSEIYLNVSKLGFMHSQKGNTRFELNMTINNDPRNIHLFKNGLLVPDSAAYIKFSEFIDGPHEIRISMVADPNDIFTVVVNHDKYTNIGSIDTIQNTGIIDLTDMIDKPFDLDWHDIFINGLKLNKSNIEYVSPYIIMLKNINTLHNVVIYEKNLDSSILSPIEKDDVTSFQTDLVEIVPDKIIDDELPDIFDEILLDYIGFIDKYLIEIGLINPDTKQLTDDMVLEYKYIMDDNENIFLDPDSLIKTSGHIMINPDDEYIPIDAHGAV